MHWNQLLEKMTSEKLQRINFYQTNTNHFCDIFLHLQPPNNATGRSRQRANLIRKIRRFKTSKSRPSSTSPSTTDPTRVRTRSSTLSRPRVSVPPSSSTASTSTTRNERKRRGTREGNPWRPSSHLHYVAHNNISIDENWTTGFSRYSR